MLSVEPLAVAAIAPTLAMARLTSRIARRCLASDTPVIRRRVSMRLTRWRNKLWLRRALTMSLSAERTSYFGMPSRGNGAHSARIVQVRNDLIDVAPGQLIDSASGRFDRLRHATEYLAFSPGNSPTNHAFA
jgi:hypothetical protein